MSTAYEKITPQTRIVLGYHLYLGKKYTLRHQQREPYTALRDVITNGVTTSITRTKE